MSAHIEWLKANGAPAEVIREAEENHLRQADYTRKTQELAATQRQIFEALASRGGGGGGGEPPRSRLQQVLDQIEGENAAPVKQLFQSVLGAFDEDLRGRFQQELGQVRQTSDTVRWNQELDAYYQERLLPMFGNNVAEVWPAVKAESMQALLRGETVHPEALVLARGEQARDWMVEQKLAADKAKLDRATEGSTQIRRTTPPMTGGATGGTEGSGAGGGGAAAAADQAWNLDRAEELVNDTLREIGLPVT